MRRVVHDLEGLGHALCEAEIQEQEQEQEQELEQERELERELELEQELEQELEREQEQELELEQDMTRIEITAVQKVTVHRIAFPPVPGKHGHNGYHRTRLTFSALVGKTIEIVVFSDKPLQVIEGKSHEVCEPGEDTPT